MKYDYLFVDHNNGHCTTYHPFTCNKAVTQELATKLLETYPGAHRMGTTVGNLMDKLNDYGHEVDFYSCPCCDQVVHTLENPPIHKWHLIEGISGNY